jgi:hypothetical protein
MLSNTLPEDACILAEHLRNPTLKNLLTSYSEQQARVAVSIRVDTINNELYNSDGLLIQAEVCLFREPLFRDKRPCHNHNSVSI